MQIGDMRYQTAMSNDATLTSQGQTTIPKGVRDRLSMKAGDRMTFTLMPDATVVVRVKTKGCLLYTSDAADE